LFRYSGTLRLYGRGTPLAGVNGGP